MRQARNFIADAKKPNTGEIHIASDPSQLLSRNLNVFGRLPSCGSFHAMIMGVLGKYMDFLVDETAQTTTNRDRYSAQTQKNT